MEKNMKKNIYIYIYIYNWITLPHSRNQHNIVNQLYFNKILKINKNKIYRIYIKKTTSIYLGT